MNPDIRCAAASVVLAIVFAPQFAMAQGAPAPVQPKPVVATGRPVPAPRYDPALPLPKGAIAADRNGDGVVDGYYTSEGIYYPFVSPSLPPPRLVSRMGERG